LLQSGLDHALITNVKLDTARIPCRKPGYKKVDWGRVEASMKGLVGVIGAPYREVNTEGATALKAQSRR